VATNLQVNASTQQAVGAFNALTASINNATNAFNRLQQQSNQGAASNRQYANSITAANSAFATLTKLADGLYNVLSLVSSGILLMGRSLLRELDKLQGFAAIMSVTTTSAAEASGAYDFLRKTADRLGLQFDSLTSNYAKLVAALPAGAVGLQIAEKVFMGIANAARTLHATGPDTQLMFYAVTQIASKGVVSMEELRRQLGEKLPGVMQIAAKALNTLPENLEAAIRKGAVISDKFLPILGDALIRTFGDSAKLASESVSASLNRLTNVWVDFVQGVISSGAGQSIVNLFDAIREKLSDPYLIARFSDMVKYLGDKFTDFVKSLTAADIRNGFDSFQHFLEVLITVLEKVVNVITWIINNGGKAGAVIGAIGGAALGTVAGPYGMAAGAVLGAGAGAYAGRSLSPTADQLAQRASSDAAAQAKIAEEQKQQRTFLYNAIVPMLGNFKDLKTIPEALTKLENANTKTLSDLNRILIGKDFKTDAAKAQGVIDYAKYGTVMSPATAQLSDVLGAGKGKKTGAEKSEDRTFLKAFGLSGDFQTEFDNLINLYKKGRLSVDQLTEGTQRLIEKQPYMVEYLRQERREREDWNRGLEQSIDAAFREVDVKERVRRSLEDESRMAGLRSDDLRIEGEVTKLVNQYTEARIVVSDRLRQAWTEEIRLLERKRELTQIGEGILGQTVDRYTPAVKQQQAMDQLVSDRSSGFSETDARDFTINSDPRFQGTQQYMDAQKRALEEYYSFIDGLRNRDRISEEAAQSAKMQAAFEYDQLRLQNVNSFFSTLAGLSQSGNSRIARIGRAAAITTATIDGYQAVNKALAAPPGWPYNAPNVIAVGAMAAANVAKIAGFEEGGFTGYGGRKRVAGVVHGEEFVVNANATARNRATLEAMNSGKQTNRGVVIEFINYGTPKTLESEVMDDGRVRMIARDEIRKNGPKMVTSQLADPNSEVSQGMRTNFNVDRRR
jgi:tape measure domain-containing protein